MSSTPKVIFRINKLKDAGKINASFAHNSRKRLTPNANSSIENVVIKDCANAYAAVLKTIGEQTIRKNAVLAVEIIISASPQYFRPNEPERAGFFEKEKLDEWRQAMEPWILQNFPHAVSVVLHTDESTPHFHVIDVPLDQNGKLSARKKFGGDSQKDLGRWQDLASYPVRNLGISRGIQGSIAAHEKIHNYYAKANANIPLLGKLPDPQPPPLLQRSNEGLIQFALSERERVYKSIRPKYLSLSAKAKSTDLANKQKEEAIATSDKLVKEKIQLKKVADQIRELPLKEVLMRVYHAEFIKGSKSVETNKKWLLDDGREVGLGLSNIGNEVWIEPGGKNGRGAINLVMSLEGLDYKDAVRLLAEYFDTTAIIADRTAQLSRLAKSEINEIVKQPLKPPTPAPENWMQVKKYLTEICALPEILIDWMHKQHKIYADIANNIVFPRELGGAFLKGTVNKSFFHSIGNNNQGAYILEGTGDVWLCSDPIDALSIKAHSFDAHVIALGGNLIKPSELKIPNGRNIISAFDINNEGRRINKEVLKLLPNVKVKSAPSGRDWNTALTNDSRLIHEDWIEISEYKKKISPINRLVI